MPIFDSACFGAGSRFFIPAFKGSRETTSNNSGAATLDEREAHERLRARKEYVRSLADVDDVVRYDKYHAANLIVNSERQRDSNTPPTSTSSKERSSNTSTSISPPPTPPSG